MSLSVTAGQLVLFCSEKVMVRVMLIQGKSLPLLGVLLSRYFTAMLPEATWDNSAAPAACYPLTQP